MEKSLESPLDCKEIQQVHPKGDQPWVSQKKSETFQVPACSHYLLSIGLPPLKPPQRYLHPQPLAQASRGRARRPEAQDTPASNGSVHSPPHGGLRGGTKDGLGPLLVPCWLPDSWAAWRLLPGKGWAAPSSVLRPSQWVRHHSASLVGTTALVPRLPGSHLG